MFHLHYCHMKTFSLFFKYLSIWQARNNLICIFWRIKLEHFLSCVHQPFYIHHQKLFLDFGMKDPLKVIIVFRLPVTYECSPYQVKRRPFPKAAPLVPWKASSGEPTASHSYCFNELSNNAADFFLRSTVNYWPERRGTVQRNHEDYRRLAFPNVPLIGTE